MYHRFPCWRFSADGNRIFQNEAELEAAGEGWYDSPALVPVAPVVPPFEPIEDADPDEDAPREDETENAGDSENRLEDLDKADLVKLADEYGIDYDGRWGRVRLIDEIRAKMEVTPQEVSPE